jgi:hypothetical protein
MTIAVCVNCGEMKLGALVPCPACKLTPSDGDDFLYAMVLSDHHLSVDVLQQVSRAMKAGQPRPSLPPEQEAHLREHFEEARKEIAPALGWHSPEPRRMAAAPASRRRSLWSRLLGRP